MNNVPLTIDELVEMHEKPVYVILNDGTKSFWGLVNEQCGRIEALSDYVEFSEIGSCCKVYKNES